MFAVVVVVGFQDALEIDSIRHALEHSLPDLFGLIGDESMDGPQPKIGPLGSS